MANSNLGCGPLTIKYLVFIFNLIFFLSGIALIIVGGIAQGFFSQYIQFFGNRYETPAIGLIIVGSIILFIAFFGCCGAKKENVFMLRIFAFLMVIVLLMEFAAAIAFAVLRPEIAKLVEKNMQDTMGKYGNDSKSLVNKAWDDMQQKYECCGTQNYTDWYDEPFFNTTEVDSVPDTCCKIVKENCGYNIGISTDPSNVIYVKPCYEALVQEAKSNLGAVIGGMVLLIVLQAIGIWMSCCLVRAVKERYEIL